MVSLRLGTEPRTHLLDGAGVIATDSCCPVWLLLRQWRSSRFILRRHQHVLLWLHRWRGWRRRGGSRTLWRGWGRLLKDALLNLLLLLQGLDKGCLQPVRVLGLQGFLLVGTHTLLTQDWTVTLVLPPAWGEVCVALRTRKWLLNRWSCRGAALLGLLFA